MGLLPVTAISLNPEAGQWPAEKAGVALVKLLFMKTIIVATDFSAAARNAAGYAAAMAKAIGAQLHLLHVFQPPVSYGEIVVAIDLQQWQRDAETTLNEWKADLQRRTNSIIDIHTEVRMGSYFGELEAVCKQLTPYAVVIGSTGKTAAERLLFGSNAVFTMKHLSWPVIAVPDGVTFGHIDKIGLACDLENIVDTVPLEEISLLVKDFQAELHVLNMGRKHQYNSDAVFASGVLGQKFSLVTPQFHFLTSANADQAILDFADKNDIDLLIVLPKRYSLPEAILHKSHTKQFVLHSHVPVMALHASPHTS
jgi:nucleotide-binding universal stress UspA family protein